MVETPLRHGSYELKEHGVIMNYDAEDDWSIDVFRRKCAVTITNVSETLEFDILNVDCTFANAIRRLLIAEVPSVCIERIYLHQNTSVMPDEVLCHRLGLIPLTVDPKLLTFPSKPLPPTDELSGFSPEEHVVFDFQAHFKKADLKSGSTRSGKDSSAEVNLPSVLSQPIYSSDLKWTPLPGQEDSFGQRSCIPAAISQNILINKLAVGDEVEARCVAVKGIGRDHAKFSPVSVAFYKFLPIIELLRPIEGEEARLLQKSFASGVIGIDPKTEQAYVLDARLDNGSREHMRHPELRKDSVFVGANPSHCLFTVESISPTHRPPIRLVRSAIDVMIDKCRHYLAVAKKPDFGESIAEGDIKGRSTDARIDSLSVRGVLNGREVGLGIAHKSPDGRRVTYIFHGEDHTLGAALRFCILHGTRASFCGYCVPHPLEDKINFDIQVKSGSAHEVLCDGLQCLQDCFMHIRSAFKRAASDYKVAPK